jgi:hypothetical protein
MDLQMGLGSLMDDGWGLPGVLGVKLWSFFFLAWFMIIDFIACVDV